MAEEPTPFAVLDFQTISSRGIGTAMILEVIVNTEGIREKQRLWYRKSKPPRASRYSSIIFSWNFSVAILRSLFICLRYYGIITGPVSRGKRFYSTVTPGVTDMRTMTVEVKSDRSMTDQGSRHSVEIEEMSLVGPLFSEGTVPHDRRHHLWKTSISLIVVSPFCAT